MINEVIFNVLMAVVVAMIGTVAQEVIPYIRKKKAEAETQIRKTRWAWVVDIVDAAVRAVEQTVSSQLHGQDKKNAAKGYIRNLLAQNGLKLDDAQIDTLIEAAVRAMNQEGNGLGEVTEPVLMTAEGHDGV